MPYKQTIGLANKGAQLLAVDQALHWPGLAADSVSAIALQTRHAQRP